jgi:hypothetical protein
MDRRVRFVVLLAVSGSLKVSVAKAEVSKVNSAQFSSALGRLHVADLPLRKAAPVGILRLLLDE